MNWSDLDVAEKNGSICSPSGRPTAGPRNKKQNLSCADALGTRNMMQIGYRTAQRGIALRY
jgi:hypothetical protein